MEKHRHIKTGIIKSHFVPRCIKEGITHTAGYSLDSLHVGV